MEKTAETFTFSSYRFEPRNKRIVFRYTISFSGAKPLVFEETITLPMVPKPTGPPKPPVKKLLEGLHIMLGISYWKYYCPRRIRLPYVLSKAEADFWNAVWKNGLEEFFYRNRLNPGILPKFPYRKGAQPTAYALTPSRKILAGMGGGKDSIVVAELLKAQRENASAFFVETGGRSELVRGVIKKTGLRSVVIGRELDPKTLLPHSYNGHIPISAVYAFLGVLTAALYGYGYVAVGNEHSSNFGNLRYRGREVNHQWSKSLEFEVLFRRYVDRVISPDIRYFSLLRPLQEIRITKLFTRYPKYFPVFSSCNRNFAAAGRPTGKWCLNCPKCAFSFLMLSAWLPQKKLLAIFGRNLYEDQKLLPLFAEVLGLGNMKPFDCVGTFEEAQTALHLAAKRFPRAFIVKTLLPRTRTHAEVFRAAPAPNLPERFRLLPVERALILGYGREGKATERFLKARYPGIRIATGDETHAQDGFDLVIKTPGISKNKVTAPYTTATNLFFSRIAGEYPIIGVTGSKGKSTTASLIHAMLKAAGKKSLLLGNIGEPMLSALLKPVPKGTIFVLELSSYQLDDIRFSPDVAVVTSLFPDHLDYHGTLRAYSEAKRNIIRFQRACGCFVYNPEDPTMRAWLKEYRGRKAPFAKHIPIAADAIPLTGAHNERNARAAVAAARAFGASDGAIRKALLAFTPLPHRLERVGIFRGITFYDDANAATPQATVEAIKALKTVDTIFLGGQDRGYDFSPLEKTLKRYTIRNVVLFPDSGPRMVKDPTPFRILRTRSMPAAVRFAYRHTVRGKICLLSCASPSYSLWKNFEEKGEEFQREVKRLGRK